MLQKCNRCNQRKWVGEVTKLAITFWLLARENATSAKVPLEITRRRGRGKWLPVKDSKKCPRKTKGRLSQARVKSL